MGELRSVPKQLFDPETGEVKQQACLGCLARDDEIRGLKRDLTNAHRRYGQLQRDKQDEAEKSNLWPLGVALWHEWKIATGHLRSRWTIERFWMAQPYLEREKFTACRYAVWGLAAAPNTKRITPDYEEVYDSWDIAFDRGQTNFERYANRGAAVFGRHLPIPASLEVPKWLRVPANAKLGSVLDEG